ncbi:unnamed protein product [Plasmodium vivax]|uniref:(malaria parasite P. vivax) hypothetical protein n=1 Tax=Plasmodium vivax TaxID=5855 RepID=A0A8S4HP85_PLAVI|nr:unnamed protein product [Plasmodium vivax]
MENNEVDIWVLTYDQYIYFKDKFDPKRPFSSEAVNLEDILLEAKITGNDRTNYLNVFDILLKHVHRDGVFFGGNNLDACKYINYILYEEVERKNYRSYDQEAIPLFRKFLDAYGEKRGKQNRCKSEINNIQRETYNIINPLYELYDKNKYCSGFVENNVQYKCKDFEEYFRLYDRYMFDTYPKSSKFYDILKNIEQHANKVLSLYKRGGGCNGYSEDLRSPRLFIPDSVPKPETHNKEQMHQNRLQSEDRTSQSETHGIAHAEQTQLPKVISILDPEQETPRTDQENSANVFHSENDDHNEIPRHPVSSHLGRIDQHIRKDEEETKMFSRYPKTFRHFNPSETSLYSGRSGHAAEQDISNEVESSPSSVMSTITSALRDVEPGPVLVVSGGMGVLFLLFKLDPSLEEEEDVSDKFPVLSMDHSQEISQIFMNMKVGILDMEQ